MDEQNPRIDGWFLCIAPLERPQLAMAVIVEGGGYGSRSAAPIAAALVLKAKELGYFNAPANQGTASQPAKAALRRGAGNDASWISDESTLMLRRSAFVSTDYGLTAGLLTTDTANCLI